LEDIGVRYVECQCVRVDARINRATPCASRVEEREVERIVPVAVGKIRARRQSNGKVWGDDFLRERWEVRIRVTVIGGILLDSRVFVIPVIC